MTQLTNGQTLLSERIIKHRTMWRVRCSCGNTRWTQPSSAKKSHSCGCMTNEILRKARTTHGHSHGMHGDPTPTYYSWKAMWDRCEPNHKSRSSYYDRGITVCGRWMDFENFLTDMGERPNGTQLGRIDNDGNYHPGNCRWETPRENASNKRSNRFLTLDNRTMTVSQWAREIGVGHDTLSRRLEMGWPVKRALTQPIKKQKNNRLLA